MRWPPAGTRSPSPPPAEWEAAGRRSEGFQLLEAGLSQAEARERLAPHWGADPRAAARAAASARVRDDLRADSRAGEAARLLGLVRAWRRRCDRRTTAATSLRRSRPPRTRATRGQSFLRHDGPARRTGGGSRVRGSAVARRRPRARPVRRRLPRALRRSRAAELRLGAAAREGHQPPAGHRTRTTLHHAWLDELEPPLVYVTMGTVFNQPELFRPLLAGLDGHKGSALVTVGRDVEPRSVRPPAARVRVERFVPQGHVLPRSAAVVSHGGSGTTLGALAHGLPLVLVPQAADQFDNAARAEAAGAALVLLPRQRDGRVGADGARAGARGASVRGSSAQGGGRDRGDGHRGRGSGRRRGVRRRRLGWRRVGARPYEPGRRRARGAGRRRRRRRGRALGRGGRLRAGGGDAARTAQGDAAAPALVRRPRRRRGARPAPRRRAVRGRQARAGRSHLRPLRLAGGEARGRVLRLAGERRPDRAARRPLPAQRPRPAPRRAGPLLGRGRRGRRPPGARRGTSSPTRPTPSTRATCSTPATSRSACRRSRRASPTASEARRSASSCGRSSADKSVRGRLLYGVALQRLGQPVSARRAFAAGAAARTRAMSTRSSPTRSAATRRTIRAPRSHGSGR